MATISRIPAPPDDLSDLAAKARQEGFNFVDRLMQDFAAGTNTFSKPGEALFEVRVEGKLVAVGGLNIDPYVDDRMVGRVRRLYVDPAHRGEGVGKVLMETIERKALDSFSELRLQTDTIRGSNFYARLGYEELPDQENVSHTKNL